VAQIGKAAFGAQATNALYYGDNLYILREYIRSESVDLVYLDPPFKSNQDYNVIFQDESGRKSDAQRLAFEDTWHWGPTPERTLHYLTNTSEHGGRVPGPVTALVGSLVGALGRNQLTAYLVEMAVRLVEMHRVLKPTGSLYLHCDPTASHYLKVLLDAIFGPQNFRNEIIWLRSKNPKGSQHGLRRFSPFTDTILYYTKSPLAPAYLDRIRGPLSAEELRAKYPYSDEHGPYADGPILRSGSMGPRPNLVYEYKGFTPGPAGWRVERATLEKIDRAGNLAWTKKGGVRRKLRPESDKGQPVGSFWGDIPPINSQAKERLGYPTQKPLALLKRIIETSTLPGDLVLDPFCGCGTAIAAAHGLGRRWAGIDITYLAIWVMKARLQRDHGLTGIDVVNAPTEVEGLRQMAHDHEGRYQFQWWVLERLGAVPPGGSQKHGADRGIDGKITFTDHAGTLRTVLVSVKSGRVDPGMVRDLRGTVERERAAMGIFVTLEEPTPAMRAEATAAGFYRVGSATLPKMQIVTARQLLAGDQAAFSLPQFTLPPFPAHRGQLPLFS
jgi:site-specific DNA-methyltransferase (adenine-specific)